MFEHFLTRTEINDKNHPLGRTKKTVKSNNLLLLVSPGNALKLSLLSTLSAKK
jgi:hypothetical protein